jgi:hypothetical protein
LGTRTSSRPRFEPVRHAGTFIERGGRVLAKDTMRFAELHPVPEQPSLIDPRGATVLSGALPGVDRLGSVVQRRPLIVHGTRQRHQRSQIRLLAFHTDCPPCVRRSYHSSSARGLKRMSRPTFTTGMPTRWRQRGSARVAADTWSRRAVSEISNSLTSSVKSIPSLSPGHTPAPGTTSHSLDRSTWARPQ